MQHICMCMIIYTQRENIDYGKHYRSLGHSVTRVDRCPMEGIHVTQFVTRGYF